GREVLELRVELLAPVIDDRRTHVGLRLEGVLHDRPHGWRDDATTGEEGRELPHAGQALDDRAGPPPRLELGLGRVLFHPMRRRGRSSGETPSCCRAWERP